VRNLYKLHSVLVHSGGVHGGHYYAFIRPDGKQWVKFDDDTVTLQSPQAAIEEQYGGEQEAPPPPVAVGGQFGPVDALRPASGVKFMKHSNAYMLVYVRKEAWDHYMCAVTKDDMPRDLRAQLEVRGASGGERGCSRRVCVSGCVGGWGGKGRGELGVCAIRECRAQLKQASQCTHAWTPY
jgi:hypothetical protein